MTFSEPVEENRGYTPHTREYRFITVALFLAGLATFASVHTTQPILPELAAGFSLTAEQSALSMSTTTVALGATLLFLGPIGDSVGRVPVMKWSLLTSALLTCLVAVMPTWPLLLAARAAVGVSVAGLPAVAVAYLREEIDPAFISRATGLYIGGTGLGGMSGRLVAGVLADVAGWRWAIAGVGLVALACGVACLFLLPDSRNFTPAPLSPRDLTSRSIAALRDPHLLALDVIGLASMGALNATFNAAPFRLKQPPLSLSTTAISFVFLVYVLGSWASAQGGRLADRLGSRPVVIGGMLLGMAGIGLTNLAPLPLFIAGLAGVTMGFFVVHGVASGWVTARAQSRGLGMGQATALYLFAYYVGAAALGWAGGRAWTGGGWSAVTWLVVGLWLVGLLATAVLGNRRCVGSPTDAGA